MPSSIILLSTSCAFRVGLVAADVTHIVVLSVLVVIVGTSMCPASFTWLVSLIDAIIDCSTA